MPQQPWHQFYENSPNSWQPSHADALTAFRAAAQSGRGGISYFGRRLTFAQIDAASERLAGWAAAQGVTRGARVAIVLQNVPAFVIAAVATWKLGAIPVPGNPGYRAAELSRVFADCRPSLVLCHPEHCTQIEPALAAAALVAPILVVSGHDQADSPDPRIVPMADPVAGAYLRLDDVLALPSAPVATLQPAPSDLALLLYTSGTTGEPKGTMLQHSSITSNAQLMADWVGVNGSSRILGLAPLFHITGFCCHMVMAFTKDCWLILNYRFEAAAVLDVIRRERPTYTVGAITAFNALSTVPGVSPADFASFDEIYSGGAPIAPALHATLKERLGIDIRNSYGMTETCAPTHMTPRNRCAPVDVASGTLSIGIPVWHTGVKVVDDNGVELPLGEVGEIWVSGPQVMQGYWNKPEDSAAALTDGWMHSGDVGFMDKDGWFFLVDRKKDMIIASGFKVWPREVEDALYGHPAIREAAVVGEPDSYRGETVVAYVSLREGSQVDAGALTAHCRSVLAPYKCPRDVRFLAELPKTVSGKIQRRALRQP